MNGEIWELWSRRTGNLLEEFATEAAALAAVAEMVAAFGLAYLDAVVLALARPFLAQVDRSAPA